MMGQKWVRHTLERSISGELEVGPGRKIIHKSAFDMGTAAPFVYEPKDRNPASEEMRANDAD